MNIIEQEEGTLVVVGALARVDEDDWANVRMRLDALPGVESFALGERARLGVVIEAPGLDAAYERLEREVSAVDGVMAVWPISVDWDSDDADVGNTGDDK